MPLTKEQKAAEVALVADKLGDTAVVYLTDYKGLNVGQVTDLRQRFRDSGVEYRVVRNTLLRRALEKAGGFDLLYDHLHGPTAVAFSSEPAAPARVIKDFTKTAGSHLPELKAAFIDGAMYAGDQIDVLASLKSKDELIADIVALLLSPIATIVGALQAPGATLASMLVAMQEEE